MQHKIPLLFFRTRKNFPSQGNTKAGHSAYLNQALIISNTQFSLIFIMSDLTIL